MTKHLFISFSSAESDFAAAAYEYLTLKNVHCWRFSDRNQIGDDWMKEIRNALDSSVAMISILSAQYVKSPVCQYEFQRALDAGLKIYPLRCNGLERSGLPLAWRSNVDLEFRAPNDTWTLEKLHSAISGDRFAVPIPTAILRLRRPKRMIGKSNTFDVLIDGRRCGYLADGSDFQWKVTPGTHTISVGYEIYHPRVSGPDLGGTASGRSPVYEYHFEVDQAYDFEAGYLGGWEGFLSGFDAYNKLYVRKL